MGAPSLSEIALFDQKVAIGVGGMAVSNSRSERLITYSLGSCVGVTIYDPAVRAGGLLHAMLPEASINPEKAAVQPAMFVDSGLSALFKSAQKLGMDKSRIQICVAGGAQIMDNSGFFNIGTRNLEMLKKLLSQNGMSVQASAVGGLVSRTIQLNIATGEVRLKTSGQNAETILLKSGT